MFNETVGVLFEVFVGDHLECLFKREVVRLVTGPYGNLPLVDKNTRWKHLEVFQVFFHFQDKVDRNQVHLLEDFL